jgi:hypothetical protein
MALIASDGEGAAPAWREDGLAAWRQATKASDGEDGAPARARALMLYSVLQALGHPVETGAWTELLSTSADPSTAPDVALWHALNQAAERRQLGLTVLLTLLVLGDDNPGAAHPLTVTGAIKALRNVGLDREARALALEAASGTAL